MYIYTILYMSIVFDICVCMVCNRICVFVYRGYICESDIGMLYVVLENLGYVNREIAVVTYEVG